MSAPTVIKVEGVSKEYRLGAINHGTLQRDIQSWWARVRGKPDPNALIREDSVSQDVGQISTTTEESKERFLALDDISFEVKEGETFGIIGRNGAGKSTLLKVLCRVTTPTTGRALIRGRIASLLEVGTGFHPELTGRENIALNGAILGMSRAEIAKKFDAIVEFSQLQRFIDTPVKRYSSGMYVRLAFSVAAHLDAEILIVDEVLAVGDYEFQRRCLQKLRDVTSNGRTVLLVSHNMSAVQNLCTRAILLQRGRIVGSGTTAHVIEAYVANPETARPMPLAFRQDRNGTGAFRFTEAVVSPYPDSARRMIRTGEGVEISVCIENRQQVPLREVDIALGIDNYVGERITIFATNTVGATIATLSPGRSRWSFRVMRLPFVAGRYYFTAFGTCGGVVADWVVSAAFFDVEHGDFFGTGRDIPPGQGNILVEYSVHPEIDNRLAQ